MGLSDGAFFMIKHTPLPNGSSRYVGALTGSSHVNNMKNGFREVRMII
jgi:hypothetical protein